MVAGEEEMPDGMINVRTREMKILGKMRVDKVAQMLKDESPAPSSSFENFYKKAFNPAAFFKDSPADSAPASNAAPAKQAAASGVAPKDTADRNFSRKLDEIEQTLSSGQ